jgi:hypothetical protein
LVELSSEKDPVPLINTYQAALESFLFAKSPEEMRAATVQYPLLLETTFINSIEETIPMHLQPEHKALFDQG